MELTPKNVPPAIPLVTVSLAPGYVEGKKKKKCSLNQVKLEIPLSDATSQVT